MQQRTAFALIENTIILQYLLKDDEIVLMEASFKGIRIPLERFTEAEIKDMEESCREDDKARNFAY